MCLIIDAPANTIIDRALLSSGLDDNRDGWGIMSAENGRIRIDRGLSRKKFDRALERHHGSEVSIHFRLATHGTTNIKNCHPFIFGGGQYALMHNGILSQTPIIDKGMSDTFNFVKYTLEPMLIGSPERFDTPEFAWDLSRMIGSYNKFVILRSDGARMIVNRQQGTMYQGLWLSNEYSIPGYVIPSYRASRFSDLDFLPDESLYSVEDRYIADNAALTLDDLAYLPIEDLAEYIASDPFEIATLIQKHFAHRCR